MDFVTRFSLKFLFALLIPFSVKAQSLAPVEGRYGIQGSNSQYGKYVGHAWVRGGQVQRVIQWTDFRFRNKKVESVWSGMHTPTALIFSLKISNVLTSFENFAPSAADFKVQTRVVVPRSAVSSSFTFSVKGEGVYDEKWNRLGEAYETPLWRDLRVAVKGTGEQKGAAIELARWIGIDLVIDWYRAHPNSQAYNYRPEFRAEEQYFIQDKTDADFYAKNPEVIRIANKTLNPLSLAEALMRRNAYAPTLEQKAIFFGQQTLQNNLNSAGLLELAVVDAQGTKVGRLPEGDAGLWTAMFAWAEVMRYQASKDPQALLNFHRILNGILTLVEITGDPKEFARALLVSSSQENLGAGWIQGQGRFAHLKWLSGGNNDMVKGVFITLALAHQVVGLHEVELRARIQRVSQALLGLSAVEKRGFNSGIAHGLVALWNQNGEGLRDFSEGVLNLESKLTDVANIDAGFYVGGIADWSGVQLTMVSNLCQILVSRELLKVFPERKNTSLIAKTLKAGEVKLWEMQKNYKKAHRDFLTIITYAFSPKAHSDTLFKYEAQEALWTLKEVPAPRKLGNAAVDLTKNPDWSLSAWPRLPWKALKGFKSLKKDLDYDFFVQGAYSYPHFETLAWQSTYLWKDAPFYLKFSAHPQVESFAADYLMVYWAARSSGLLPAGK